MKDYELFEVMVQRLREAGLLTDDELMEHRQALTEIRKKLYPSPGRGRPPQYPSRRLMAARFEAARQAFDGEISQEAIYGVVAAYSTRRLGIEVQPSAIREVHRHFGGKSNAKWFEENLKLFRDRYPDLLPTPEELKNLHLGKIKI